MQNYLYSASPFVHHEIWITPVCLRIPVGKLRRFEPAIRISAAARLAVTTGVDLEMRDHPQFQKLHIVWHRKCEHTQWKQRCCGRRQQQTSSGQNQICKLLKTMNLQASLLHEG